MKTVAIIQARMSSTRLPGKVLLPLGNQSVLSRVIERVRACTALDEIVIATTDELSDDAIVDECRRLNATRYRGSLDDVLSRYYLAAQAARADVIVRITSDCPLFDPWLLEKMLRLFAAKQQGHPPVDYLSNVLKRSYPRGLDAEIFTNAALRKAHEMAVLPREREHVTPYLYQHPELFHLHSYENETDESCYRWTLDTPEDYELIDAIYRALSRPGSLFTTKEVLNLLKERPELTKLNAHVEQKKIGA